MRPETKMELTSETTVEVTYDLFYLGGKGISEAVVITYTGCWDPTAIERDEANEN